MCMCFCCCMSVWNVFQVCLRLLLCLTMSTEGGILVVVVRPSKERKNEGERRSWSVYYFYVLANDIAAVVCVCGGFGGGGWHCSCSGSSSSGQGDNKSCIDLQWLTDWLNESCFALLPCHSSLCMSVLFVCTCVCVCVCVFVCLSCRSN